MPLGREFHWLYKLQSKCQCSPPGATSHSPLFTPVGWVRCLFPAKRSLTGLRFPAFSPILLPLPFASFKKMFTEHLLNLGEAPSKEEKLGTQVAQVGLRPCLEPGRWASLQSLCNWWGMTGFGHSLEAGSWIWEETGRGPKSWKPLSASLFWPF